MGLATLGVLVNLLMATVVSVYIDKPFLTINIDKPFMLIAWLLFSISSLGLILTSLDMKKVGGIMIIIGSILFLPFGLVGVLGGKKIMNETDDIVARRRLAEENYR